MRLEGPKEVQEVEVEREEVEEEGNEVVEDWEGKAENEKGEGEGKLEKEEKEEERRVLMVGEDMKGEEKVVWEAAVERQVVMRLVGDDR